MKNSQKISVLVLLHCSSLLLAETVAPYFSIRSQATNIAREMVGWTNHVNLYDVGNLYGSGSFTLEYTRSTKSNRIAQCLFGSDLLGDRCDCAAITISGSAVSDRNVKKDWLADYFGLPTDFQSTLNFRPRIENVIADFNFFLGLDNWLSGLWFRLDIPLVYTKWDFNFRECISNAGTKNLPIGYFSDIVTLGTEQPASSNIYPNAYGVARASLLNSFEEFSGCKKVPNLGTNVTFKPLCFAQMGSICEPKTKTKIADLQFALGYNFWQNGKHHAGLGILGAAPTGNAPEGISVFEPIVGNGNHWEVGLFFTSHFTFWQTEDEFQHVGLYIDGTVSHLFKTKQKRTFDLKNKPNSRYMLAEKLGTPVNSLFAFPTETNLAIPVAPSAQFKNELSTIANLTTLDVDVSVGVQADIAFMLAYRRGDLVWDVGYNLWVRNCEKIKLDCTCPTPFADKTWELKGDSYVYGFDGADAPPNRRAIALSATQSKANIHQGTNAGSTSPISTNPNVDNVQFAYSKDVAINPATGDTYIFNRPDASTFDTANGLAQHTKTSKDPLFLTDCDIDLDGARTKGLSHKLFTNISYTWSDMSGRWAPYLGVGAEGEFHPTTDPCPDPCGSCPIAKITDECDTKCNRCGVSQWGVWVKGGVSFNLS